MRGPHSYPKSNFRLKFGNQKIMKSVVFCQSCSEDYELNTITFNNFAPTGKHIVQ